MTSLQFQSGPGLVLNAEIDESSIFALGEHAPRLIVPVRLLQVGSMGGDSGTTYELSALSGDLSVVPPSGSQEMVSTAVFCPICCPAPNATSVQLHFPIDHPRLAWLETIRNGGETISFFLNLRLTAKKMRLRQPDPAGARYDYVCETCDTRQGTIQIQRTTWMRVLEGTKFGKIHVLEFPATPVEQCTSLRNAFAALQEAQRLHRQGFYSKAVGECRVALDKFWDEGPKRLQTSWIAKIGEANHKWLHEVFSAIRKGTNEPHHNAPCDFDQFDSQLFIAVTTAYVAFVARAGVSE